MEFWGVEVKAGEPVKVEPEDDMVLHLSQACLGETKSKGNESIILNVKVGDQKFVLGNLSVDKFPQLSFDLVFEKEFELSHNWKNGSIHLCGYQTFVGDNHGEEDFDDFEDSEEEDVVPSIAGAQNNGKVKVEEAKPTVAKGAAKPESSGKQQVKVVEPKKGDEHDDSDGSDEDDSSDDEDDSEEGSDEDMLDGDDSDDDDDSDDASDEETPKKPASNKKRPNESAAVKTPVSSKKAKTASPKSDGKKVGGHVATPHPAKKPGKTPSTPATADKSKQQTPKTGGSISCKSCTKTFGSDKALESHTKAKHG